MFRVLLLIGLLSPFLLAAQDRRADSLQQILASAKTPEASFDALRLLGDHFAKTDPMRATQYYTRAIALPVQSRSAEHFVQCYISLGELYQGKGLYDSSLLFFQQALRMALQFNLDKAVGSTHVGIGLDLLRLQKHDSARYHFNQALPLFIKTHDAALQANLYVTLGNLHLEETNYAEALNQFIKAANLFEGEAHDNIGLGRALLNIANIESILQDYDKAIQYAIRGRDLAIKNQSDPHIAYAHNLMGRISRKLKKLDEALTEYRAALAIYHRRGERRNEAEVQYAIGNILFDKKAYSAAIENYRTSLQLAHQIDNTQQMAYTYSGLGEANHQLKNYAVAIAYMDSSARVARSLGNLYLVMDAYETKSNIYEELHDYRNALLLHQQYSALKDSITKNENGAAVAELEAKYQNTKKQAEINLLQKDQQLKDIMLHQGQLLELTLGAALVLLLIMGFLILNRNKVINRVRRLMEIEKVRNQIARDLHDDMGSTLSSINILSDLALHQSSPEVAKRYFKQIGEHSAKMMESMDDMVWSVNPENDFIQKTVAKMKEFAAEMLEAKGIGYRFDVEDSLDMPLDAVKRKNVFLIFKEAVNNAAKYSQGTTVAISFRRSGSKIVLSVQDDGRGFNPELETGGNGLRNMKQRAAEIDATLAVETSPGKGVKIQLTFPVT